MDDSGNATFQLGTAGQLMMMSFICSCRNKNQPKAMCPKGTSHHTRRRVCTPFYRYETNCEDTPSRPHATTTPYDPPPTPTRRDDSRYSYDATGRPEPPIAPLFHSNFLNCNLWYLLDLLSNKSFDIGPFPSSLRLHQQDPISHTGRVHISRPTATSS